MVGESGKGGRGEGRWGRGKGEKEGERNMREKSILYLRIPYDRKRRVSVEDLMFVISWSAYPCRMCVE
jgi:hypothetical protein